jgi:hypothetical protein
MVAQASPPRPEAPVIAVDYTALHRGLAEGITARRVAEHEWAVTSGTRAAVEYTVSTDGESVTCTCLAGQHGRHGCKHAALVRVLDLSGAVPNPRRSPLRFADETPPADRTAGEWGDLPF